MFWCGGGRGWVGGRGDHKVLVCLGACALARARAHLFRHACIVGQGCRAECLFIRVHRGQLGIVTGDRHVNQDCFRFLYVNPHDSVLSFIAGMWKFLTCLLGAGAAYCYT